MIYTRNYLAKRKDWGGTLTGAGTGFKMGSSLGSLFGPIGTTIGAGVGIIGGAIFGNASENKREREQRKQQAYLNSLINEERKRSEYMNNKLLRENDQQYLSNFRLNNNGLFMKSGGTIYIKPQNRGKFNALKKRTGKSTEELTHSKNPLTRKRAIFAQNARKWNHALGGQIEDPNKLINIKDKRKIDMVTGKPLSDTNRMHANVNSNYIKDFVIASKKHGVDPYTAIAIALQETGLGRESLRNPMINHDSKFIKKAYDNLSISRNDIKHYYKGLLGDQIDRVEENGDVLSYPNGYSGLHITSQRELDSLYPNQKNNKYLLKYLKDYKYVDSLTNASNWIDPSVQYLKEKINYAKKLGKNKDEDIIQAWNGYGVLKGDMKAYGLPLPIDMSKNPIYGKRVVNLRDSVIRTNPEIVKIVNSFKAKGGPLDEKRKQFIALADEGAKRYRDNVTQFDSLRTILRPVLQKSGKDHLTSEEIRETLGDKGHNLYNQISDYLSKAYIANKSLGIDMNEFRGTNENTNNKIANYLYGTKVDSFKFPNVEFPYTEKVNGKTNLIYKTSAFPKDKPSFIRANGGPLDSIDNDSKEWISNWLNNRKGILKNNILAYKKEFSDNTPVTDIVVDGVIDQQLKGMNRASIALTKNLSNKGEYNKKTGEILISGGLADGIQDGLLKRTVTHERTHSLNPDPQYVAIKNLLKQHYPYGLTNDTYLNNPSEIYSRLMGFRKEMNLKPDYVVNENDIKTWRKNLQSNELNHYPKKMLLELFNGIAQNTSRKQDKFMAAYGGSIKAKGIKLSEGNKLLTTKNGSTSGFHETGQNLPIKRKNRIIAYAEPGEVLVTDKDIVNTPFVLSKRLGFAQDFMKLEDMKSPSNKKVIEKEQSNLVKMNNRLVSRKPAPLAFAGIPLSIANANAGIAKKFINGKKIWNNLKENQGTIFGAAGTVGNLLMANKTLKYQRGLINDSLNQTLSYKPVYNKSYLLNDNIDINDSVSAINQGYNSVVSGLNGIDPAIASAMKNSANNMKVRQLGSIYGQRNNLISNIRNQNTMSIASNNASNNQLTNETALMKLNARINANEQLGELAGTKLANTQGAITEFNTILRDKEMMDSLKARWKDSIGNDFIKGCGGKLKRRRKSMMLSR